MQSINILQFPHSTLQFHIPCLWNWEPNKSTLKKAISCVCNAKFHIQSTLDSKRKFFCFWNRKPINRVLSIARKPYKSLDSTRIFLSPFNRVLSRVDCANFYSQLENKNPLKKLVETNFKHTKISFHKNTLQISFRIQFWEFILLWHNKKTYKVAQNKM
jgi:hypothetical protein